MRSLQKIYETIRTSGVAISLDATDWYLRVQVANIGMTVGSLPMSEEWG